MAEELTKAVILAEPTKIDTAASDSCTRSGAFALLLSLALVSLIPYWLRERDEITVSRYLALRFNLATSIELLDDDVEWRTYKASHEAAESMSIEQLLKVDVEDSTNEANTSQVQSASSTTGEDKISQDTTSEFLPLSSPTRLRIISKIAKIQEIADFFRKLNDLELLTNTRKASSFYDNSIYRWDGKRTMLINRAMHVANPGPALGKEALLMNLPLRDVRDLAQFELPKISNTVQLAGRHERGIEIPLGSLPQNLSLFTVSVCIEVLLLLVIMYFNAFTLEAVSSAMFPVPGTLFSAFSHSPWTLGVFLIALWSPLLASLVVAVVLRSLLLSIFSVLIFCAVHSVHLVFWRKSYFTALKLRLPMQDKWLGKNVFSKDLQASNENPD